MEVIMSKSPFPDRRKVLAVSAAVAASSLMPTQGDAATASDAIRPFRVDVPKGQLVDLRRRIAATRWPERQTVADASQGVPLAMMQDLAHYWATDYDWRRCETKLNALPQFITEIDGLDIHFIHVRSKNDLLTNPASHGASASDAFHLVIPSLPGFGFSGKPTATGWGPERTARAWVVLMQQLGYAKFVAQGGDLGAGVCTAMANPTPSSSASTPFLIAGVPNWST
jgi:Epoxide hydrolase N terminus